MGLFSRKEENNDSRQARFKGLSGSAFGLDLGTWSFRLYNSQTDRVLVERNMIAVRGRNTMIAYGDEAFEMYEKAPSGIQVSFPMGGGVIADIRNMEMLVREFIRDEQRGSFRPADYYISIPTDVTEVERKAFCDLIREAGIRARNIFGVERAVADCLGLGIDVMNSQGILIVDVGYDTTEVSVLSFGGIVLSKILKVGGHTFDTAIVNAVRKEQNLQIGMKTAEKIRISADRTDSYGADQTVYGRDILSGLPVERTLPGEFIIETLGDLYSQIAGDTRILLERTPPELSADIYRQGIYITGGASQSETLTNLMQQEVHRIVNIASDPVCSAVIGLGQIIRNRSLLPLVFTIEGLA